VTGQPSNLISIVSASMILCHCDTTLAEPTYSETLSLTMSRALQISGEESKYGVEPGDALPLCRHVHQECQNLCFAGLMTIGMADYTSRPENFQVGCRHPPRSAVCYTMKRETSGARHLFHVLLK